MANIFTRKAVDEILKSEGLTPEERLERVMALQGRALDDGYISKTAAQEAQTAAIEAAKAEALAGVKAPDPKESDEYKALRGEFDAYKSMMDARTSDDFKGVKGKFFETVYSMVKREDGAKPVAEQLADIRKEYEEYFEPVESEQKKDTPQYSRQAGHSGVNPDSDEDKLYRQLSENWK